MTETQSPPDVKARMLKAWEFPWPVMDVLIGGKSSIDLTELGVMDWEEATAFLKSYGYDPDERWDKRNMHAILVEALSLIESNLITAREWERGVKPPPDILACDDTRKLLIWASEGKPAEAWRQAWACALLRVMHTIAHIEGVTRHHSIDIARDEITRRFHRFVFRGKDGRLYLGDGNDHIRLERMEWKNLKTRESIILKLLHKRDNVAETIYDLLGVRLVTTHLCDVMTAVKYLRQFHIVTFPNCVPTRARNNLIDVKRYRVQVDALRDMLQSGTLEPEEFEEMVRRITASEVTIKINPHSSSTYRSIQLTCRQLIRSPNPELGWLAKMRGQLDTDQLPPEKQKILEELRFFVDGWHSVREARSVRAFFPFEVQIMDAASFEETQNGSAAHEIYKKSQIRAARKRVLQRVLELARKRSRDAVERDLP